MNVLKDDFEDLLVGLDDNFLDHRDGQMLHKLMLVHEPRILLLVDEVSEILLHSQL